MPKDGRTFVKPGDLAQTMNKYELIKQETIERNNKRIEALSKTLGFTLLPIATSLISSSQTTAEGKRKVDWDHAGDKDYHPPENEEGDDDEFYGSEPKKRSVPLKNKERTVKKKQSRWPVGAMAASLQPVPTSSPWPPSPITDQMQPRAATDQPHAPPTMTKKLPRQPAGAMAATSQPLPTISQLPPSAITDQTQPRPATDQPQGPPTVKKRLPRWPVGAMAATSQPSLNSNQLQPATNNMQPQMQPATNNLQPLLTTNLPEPPPTVSRKQSRRADGSTAAARGSGPSYKGRGPSRPYKDWGTGKKLQVVLDKETNKPIGDTAAILESQLGIIARNGNFAPLIYTDWRASELNPYKERIWDEVKDNTNVPEVYKHNCLMSVSKKWRDWKDYIKRTYYDKYETDAQRLKNCPDRVDSDQWRILVAFWGGQCAKERSDRNLANREFQTMGHTSGRKSHCRVRAELAKEKDVEPNEVDRIMVFEKTHTNKDGKPIDKDSATAMARLKEGISEVPESLQSPTFKEEVFTRVLGQDNNGYVRTYGLGPCPSQVFGTRFTRSKELHDREQLREEVRNEVVDEVRKVVADQVRKEVLAEFGNRFSRLERKCARFEAHAKDIGYPLPPFPEEDSPRESSRNKQNGSRQPCNEHVLDANSPGQQNGDNNLEFFKSWTDHQLQMDIDDET